MSNTSNAEKPACKTRTQLIQAGLQELIDYGFLNFSTRRVAKNCGVSCAAPYKHFEDTEAFITAIMEYINTCYVEAMETVLQNTLDQTPKEQLTAIALGYIQFAVTHPDYFYLSSRIPQNHPAAVYALSAQFNDHVWKLANQVFMEHPVTEEKKERVLFMARSIVYGATILFANDQLEWNEKNREMIRSLLFREIDL